MTKEVFTELVLKNEDILYKIAMSMLKNEADAQDAMQSAILKAFERLSTLTYSHTAIRQKKENSRTGSTGPGSIM